MSSYYCHHCGDQVPTGIEHLCKVVARKRITDLERKLAEAEKENERVTDEHLDNSMRWGEALKQHKAKAREAGAEALAVLDKIIDSFPDGKPPHPSIAECIEGARLLRQWIQDNQPEK